MTWLLVVLLALAAFAALAWLLKTPRAGWEAIGAALAVGLAGFAFQASSAQPGAPKQAAERHDQSGEALIDARKALSANPGQVNTWMIISDAMSRRGQFGDAASVALGAVEKDPRNADAWLSIANNLTAHADGALTPAALYAYRRAAAADPQHPGPYFFLGLALAQNGKLAEGRALWADLLARAPADAPWRADLATRLKDLDKFIAKQSAAQ